MFPKVTKRLVAPLSFPSSFTQDWAGQLRWGRCRAAPGGDEQMPPPMWHPYLGCVLALSRDTQVYSFLQTMQSSRNRSPGNRKVLKTITCPFLHFRSSSCLSFLFEDEIAIESWKSGEGLSQALPSTGSDTHDSLLWIQGCCLEDYAVMAKVNIWIKCVPV